jgi:hypothetical protein
MIGGPPFFPWWEEPGGPGGSPSEGVAASLSGVVTSAQVLQDKETSRISEHPVNRFVFIFIDFIHG